MAGAALGILLGLWAFEVRAEESVPKLAGQVDVVEPGPELALAMGRYLGLRQSALLVGSEAEATRLDRAAAEVARACGGKLPGDCLFAEALALAATAEEPEDKPRDAAWLTRSEAQRKSVVYLTKAGKIDAARQLALAITDGTDRNRALRNMVRVLAADGSYEPAIELFADFEERVTLAEAASDVVAWMVEAERIGLARDMLPRVAEIANRIKAPDLRGKPLAKVAFLYLRIDEISAAMGMIGQIEDEYWQNAVSIGVAEALAAKGETEAALRVADGVKNDDRQESEAIEAVAVSLAEAGRADEARRAADRFEDPFVRAVLIARIAAGLSKAGQTEAAMALFAEAEAMGAGLAEPEDQAVVMASVAVALIDASRVEEALALTEQVKDLGGEIGRMRRAYLNIAEALIAAGESGSAVPLLGMAEGIAGQIADEGDRSSALLEIARVLIKGGEFAEAERVALGIGKPSYRVFALRDLGVAHCEAGLGDKADLANVERLVGLIAGVEGDEAARDQGLAGVAKALAESGEVAAAEAVADAAVEQDWRAQALAEAAEVLAATHPAEAERIARRVEDAGLRAVALGAVAAGL